MSTLRLPTVSIFRSPKVSVCFTLVIIVFLAATNLTHAQAQTFQILYSFPQNYSNGFPSAGLLLDSAGNLYGTTAGSACSSYTNGYGIVFTIDSSGNQSVLHSFDSTDGACPFDSLIGDDAGNLYGTTMYGGSFSAGNVFKIDASGNETDLYDFNPGQSGNQDGCYPFAALLRDSAGNLYGTTTNCGAFTNGTVFKIDPSGKETILHNFAGGAGDGAYPWSGLIMDAAGALYGTTAGGADDWGVLYKLTPDGKLKILHSFAGGTADGCYPEGTPLRDAAGNFYGTTTNCGAFGFGIVWKITKKGHETVLHNFKGSDGAQPSDAGLIFDRQGNMYGVTGYGGASNYGVVYKLAPGGALTVLHVFKARSGQGAKYPQGRLIMDNAGNLYGTTFEGGRGGGNGTVWKLKP